MFILYVSTLEAFCRLTLKNNPVAPILISHPCTCDNDASI